MSIGKFAQSLILTNPELTNTQILEKVLEVYPTAKTSMACIAWYKSDMRKKGQLASRKAQPASVEDQIKYMEAKLAELKAKQAPAPVESPVEPELVGPVEEPKKKGKKAE